MATRAGFADVTRLTLAMETELVKEYRPYFDKKEEDGVFLQLKVDENGRPSIAAEKAGKPLKSVPAGLKKNAYYLQLKEIHTKLKEQHSRCVKMFEQAMEERDCLLYTSIKAIFFLIGAKIFLQGLDIAVILQASGFLGKIIFQEAVIGHGQGYVYRFCKNCAQLVVNAF